MALIYIRMGSEKGRFLTSGLSLPPSKPNGYTCNTELNIKNILTQRITVLNAFQPPPPKKSDCFPVRINCLNTLRTGLLNYLNARSRGLIQSVVRFL